MTKFYKNIWCLPSLVLHELSHIFVALLLFGRIKKIQIKRLDCVRLYISNLNTLTQVRLVAFSPILVPLVFSLLSLKDLNFVWGVVYLLSTFRTTVPSLVDFKTAQVPVPSFIKNLYNEGDEDDEEVFDLPDEDDILVDSTN
jgi:hypothetical protein